MCQEVDTENVSTEKFTEYVAYNEHGGMDKRVPREFLEELLENFELWNETQLGCWELRRVGEEIHVRLSPMCELDGRDNLWHSWNYTFVPYVP